MSKISVFLSVTVNWTCAQSDRSYLDQIEDSIHQLATRFQGVRAGTSSASERQGGRPSETFALILSSEASSEHVTDAIISEMRRIGIKKGFSIILSKRVIDRDGEKVYERKVLPKRNTQWIPASTTTIESSLSNKTEGFPQRIQYLRDYIQRYYLVGGNDVSSVFRQSSELHEFLSSLSTHESSELREAYKKIVSNSDHQWMMQWVSEDCKGHVSLAKAQTIYFLAFLDRLCDGGLLNNVHDFDRIELVDWDLLAE